VIIHATWSAAGLFPTAFTLWGEVRLSWDRAFGYLGLRMMQEANEKALEDDLAYLARLENDDEFFAAAREQAHALAASEGIVAPDFRLSNIRVADEDFQTVLLQFDALGLIRHSQKNRSVKDTRNYWTLTPFGHTRLVQLRAISRGEDSLQRDADEDGGQVIAESPS
jgi:hypothetical protein